MKSRFTCTANAEVREALKLNGIFLYELAEAMEYSENHFIKIMHKEMSSEMKQKALMCIAEIAEVRRKTQQNATKRNK